MELKNILIRMEKYLKIAQKCKNGSDKIEFYKNHFDAFSLGESDDGELFQNILAQFCTDQNFSEYESEAFYEFESLDRLKDISSEDKKLYSNLKIKFNSALNEFKIFAFDNCVIERLPEDIKLIKEEMVEY